MQAAEHRAFPSCFCGERFGSVCHRIMAATQEPTGLWQRFQKYYAEFPGLGLALDASRVQFPDDFLGRMEGPIQKAFAEMVELEKGAIANADEKRMVG